MTPLGGANHKIKLVTARRFAARRGKWKWRAEAPLSTTYDAGFFT